MRVYPQPRARLAYREDQDISAALHSLAAARSTPSRKVGVSDLIRAATRDYVARQTATTQDQRWAAEVQARVRALRTDGLISAATATMMLRAAGVPIRDCA